MATVLMSDTRGHGRYTQPVYRIDTTTPDRCMDSLVRLQPRTERIIRTKHKEAIANER